jgi:hypothetical protein
MAWQAEHCSSNRAFPFFASPSGTVTSGSLMTLAFGGIAKLSKNYYRLRSKGGLNRIQTGIECFGDLYIDIDGDISLLLSLYVTH